MDNVEAMEFAKANGIAYIETSATENKNVRLLFERCVFEHWAQTVRRQNNKDGVSDRGHVPKLPSVSISNSQSMCTGTTPGLTPGSTPGLTPGSSGHTVIAPMESTGTPDGQETRR